MVDNPRRPLLNPVLRFTKEPKPEGVSGGGKNAGSIMAERLPEQRRVLSRQFRALAAQAAQRPRFDGRVVLYASMFDDSLAPSYTPNDLFQATRSARLIAPYRSGYLVEMAADQLGRYAGIVESSGLAKDQVDISRIESVRFFESEDAGGSASLDEIWEAAPETDAGKAFVVWLMPLRGRDAAEELIQRFAALRDGTIVPPPPLLAGVDVGADTDVPVVMRRALRAAGASGDRINLAMRTYRLNRRARTTVLVPSRPALDQLVASGTVFRIEPVQPISSTSPGEGELPSLYFEIGLGAFMFRFEQDQDPMGLPGETSPKKFPSVNAAKAAAQADYERRILSALEPAAPESEPRPMTGFFSNLSPEEQAAALAYDGPEPNIGDTAPEGQQEPVAWQAEERALFDGRYHKRLFSEEPPQDDPRYRNVRPPLHPPLRTGGDRGG